MCKTNKDGTTLERLGTNPTELAEIAGVSPRTVTRWCVDGLIPATKIAGLWIINLAGAMAALGLSN